MAAESRGEEPRGDQRLMQGKDRWVGSVRRIGARQALRVRSAGSADVDALVRIEMEAFANESERIHRRQWHRLVGRAAGLTMVAELDQRPVGALVLTYREGGTTLRIYSIGVEPGFRRRGVGGRLLAYAFAVARRRRLALVRLEVRSDNHPALALYRSYGFEVRQRIAHYYGLGEDAFRMEAVVAQRWETGPQSPGSTGERSP